MAIAVQSDPKDIEDLKQIFQELDKDGNGSITLDELQAGLGDRENGKELMDVMRAADTDKSGAINYTGKSNAALI
jgi:calcium-dependent protein kinase